MCISRKITLCVRRLHKDMFADGCEIPQCNKIVSTSAGLFLEAVSKCEDFITLVSRSLGLQQVLWYF